MTALKVVVAGYGMAGSRLVEELRGHDPDADRISITAVGAEPVPPYNRVMLSAVLSGSLPADAIYLQDDDWAARHRVDCLLDVSVRALDRQARRILLSSGEWIGYDVLVLAVGAKPWIPPTRGLRSVDGELVPSVVSFQSIGDCELIGKQVSTRTPVAVIGGGVLGMEAAHALSTRTDRVTVVHPMDWVMERQLDRDAGLVLARQSRARGIRIRLGRTAVEYVPGEGVMLDDGSGVPADWVVVAAGVRPDVSLALAAGLRVDRGIVVDDSLRTSDPAIFAIGDCARHPGAPPGFVQPAWEQAGVLAESLARGPAAPRYRGTSVIARLKASGIELAAMGEVHIDVHSTEDEVIAITDPARGRYAKLVLREDFVRGAVLLGLPHAAAQIMHHYDHRTPVPADRAALLLGQRGAQQEEVDVLAIPDSTVVCRCNNVTKESVLTAWRDGARNVDAVAGGTRATTGCGGCGNLVRTIVERLAEQST